MNNCSLFIPFFNGINFIKQINQGTGDLWPKIKWQVFETHSVVS